MGKVIMSGIVPQVVAPVTLPANFADATWEQIIDVCQKNKVPDTWAVGDQNVMTIDGTDYAIDIIGKNHDIYSDGSGTAPLTFQMHCGYKSGHSMNSTDTNAGGWTNCAMRTTHLPSILSSMPVEVQNAIKEVKKLTSAGGQSASIVTTADKLFLLSEIEVFGSTTNSYAGEGTQYEYYAAGNSKAKQAVSGGRIYWYERSPYSKNGTYFCYVDLYGNTAYTFASEANRAAPAFCF